MRILVVNQFHPPPGGGGPARFDELGRIWAKSGHEVLVLTSSVAHVTGKNVEGSEPRETHGAGWLEILRIPIPALDKSSAVKRVLRDATYMARAALRRFPRGGWRPEVVIASSPPLLTGIAGRVLARRLKVPWVMEVRDLWPDAAIEFGELRGSAAKLALRLEKYLYDSADHVVVLTPGFAPVVEGKGVPAAKVSVIPNGVDLSSFTPHEGREAVRARLGWGDRFVLLYAGVMGPSQGLEQVVTAARHLQGTDALFALFGSGSDRAKLEAAAQGLDNVRFYEPVPRSQVPDLFAAADAGLSTLRDLPALARVYPAKVLETMACGRPVVFAGRGSMADMLTFAQAGAVATPDDPQSLQAAVRSLMKDRPAASRMGANGRALVASKYARHDLASEYVTLLEWLVDRVIRQGSRRPQPTTEG